jgi:hypothetical protein
LPDTQESSVKGAPNKLQLHIQLEIDQIPKTNRVFIVNWTISHVQALFAPIINKDYGSCLSLSHG